MVIYLHIGKKKMANITINVPVRTINGLTPLNNIPVDRNVMSNVKIPVGNLPIGVSGECATLAQLVEVLPLSTSVKEYIQAELVKADGTNYNLVLSKILGEIARATAREDTLEAKINTNLNGMYAYVDRAAFDDATTKPTANSVVLIGSGENTQTYIWNGTDLIEVDFSYAAMLAKVKDELENEITRVSSGVTALNLFLSQKAQDKITGLELLEESLNEQILKLVTAQQTIIRILTKFKSSTGASAVVEPMLAANYVLGKPNGLIILDFETSTTNLPDAKGTVLQGQLKINVDGQLINCYSAFEVQGSGSAAYPKKNWSFSLYSDTELTKEITLSIGGTLAQQEWVFKANYTDKAQVRNLLNYNLWGELLNTRTGNYPIKDIDLSYLSATGDVVYTKATTYPSGFNCVLNINGSFYGIGQFMIGKKRENYNMPKSGVANKVLIGFDNLAGFRVDVLAEGTYELRAPSKSTANTKSVISSWATYAQSDQTSFTANKGSRFSTRNITDFYIYSQLTGNIDGVTNNTHMATWDGIKWVFLPYDMDLTFKDFRMSADTTDVFSYGGDNLAFWNKVKTAYSSELKARYAELRNSSIISVANLRKMYLNIAESFTLELHNAELTKWANREATSPYGGGEVSAYNVQDFCNWVQRRIVYLDKLFSYVAF